jgi:hypothetical protein
VYELRGEVYTQHMFSRASYRSRLEIKELHLPGAYPAREPECERVEVVLKFFTCERTLRSYVLMCVCVN